MKRIFIVFAAGLITLSPAMADAQVGITGVPFLQIEPDSRGAGMGNTGVATADNAAAIFWNPAGLGFQTDNQASITHSNWLQNFNVKDLFYDYVVVKQHVKGLGTFGAHLTFLNLGEQAQTAENGPEIISRFNSYELALGMAYGADLNKHLAIGGGLRVIYSSLASGTLVSGQKIDPGSSVGVDLALLYRTGKFGIGSNEAEFRSGINLSNFGPGIQYSDNAQKDPIPTLLRFGSALDLSLDEDNINELTLAFDVSKVMARKEAFDVVLSDTVIVEYRSVGPARALFESWDTYKRIDSDGKTINVGLLEQFMIGGGLEYWYNRRFAIRGGYYYESPNNGDRNYITFGAGLRYNMFGVDFSYIKTLKNDHPLANTLRFSLLLNY